MRKNFEITVKFTSGNEIYESRILDLLKSDPGVIEVMDNETGEILYDNPDEEDQEMIVCFENFKQETYKYSQSNFMFFALNPTVMKIKGVQTGRTLFEIRK